MLRPKSLSYADVMQEYQFRDWPPRDIRDTPDRVFDRTEGSPSRKYQIQPVQRDKLAGFLDGEETKTLMFIKNKIKGGGSPVRSTPRRRYENIPGILKQDDG